MRTKTFFALLLATTALGACSDKDSGGLFVDESGDDGGAHIEADGSIGGGDASSDGSIDASPDVEPGGACEQSSSCAAPTEACRVAVCEEGQCGSQLAPPGTPCGTGGSCDASGACVGSTTTECTPLTADCEGTMPRACDAEGNWRPQAPCPSPYKCSDGACTVTCAPGSRRCDGKTAQVCGPSGEWESFEACSTGCLDGACTGACTAGAKRCKGDLAQECDASGRYQTKTTCAFACDSGTGTCAECEPGMKRCAGSGLQICGANGKWGSGPACGGGKQCVGGECVTLGAEQKCAPDAKACNGNSVWTCNGDGTDWADKSSCGAAACVAGRCVGICAPDSKRCSGKQPETCNQRGEWEASGAACSDAQGCQYNTGTCVSQPVSCKISSTNGTSWCSPSEDCCVATDVPAGGFYRGNDGVNGTDTSRHANLSGFRLGKRHVTEARFRSFVGAVVKGFTPPVGSGKHAHLNGGAGLNGMETGWQVSWNAYLPKDEATWASETHLKCSDNATYDAHLGGMRPINCVNWYQAQAFCIWDGGFLPSETEWHYAASGGSEQRVFPWSSPATSATIDDSFANYGCMGDGEAGCALKDILNVDTKEKGQGRWGHFHLAGNMSEWVFDAFTPSYPLGTCSDCATMPTSDAAPRVIRGGSWKDEDVKALQAIARQGQSPLLRSDTVGFRCAYAP